MIVPRPSIEEHRKFAEVRVDAVNHALDGLPEDRVRYHICWGSWHGPHTSDIPEACGGPDVEGQGWRLLGGGGQSAA
jgi:hypothetical protein